MAVVVPSHGTVSKDHYIKYVIDNLLASWKDEDNMFPGTELCYRHLEPFIGIKSIYCYSIEELNKYYFARVLE